MENYKWHIPQQDGSNDIWYNSLGSPQDTTVRAPMDSEINNRGGFGVHIRNARLRVGYNMKTRFIEGENYE
jgi:hypothetical protein